MYVYAFVDVCKSVYMCVYACLCVCLYVCVLSNTSSWQQI